MLFGHERGRTESKAKFDHLRTNANFQRVQSENNSLLTLTPLWHLSSGQHRYLLEEAKITP